MHLESLRLRNFRNYEDFSATFSPQGAVITGNNGVGKTSLLESIHLLCTGRSHRVANRLEMIRFNQDSSYVEGVFVSPSPSVSCTAFFGFSTDKKVRMKLDDVPVASMTDWLNHGIAIAFGPDDLLLISGPPAERRRFLDILLAQIDKFYLSALIAYRNHLMQRNALLAGVADSMQFEVYEEQMATEAAFIASRRLDFLNELSSDFKNAYHTISAGDERASIEYQPSPRAVRDDINAQVYREAFSRGRESDIQRGFTLAGPHRDEINILLNDRVARKFASQGQRRSLALSLRLASVAVGERLTKKPLIFLVDDAASELDSTRTGKVYPLLRGRGQAFISAPDLDRSLLADLPYFRLKDSQLEAL